MDLIENKEHSDKKIAHILTDSDIEDLLLKIDDLYWYVLHLSRKRLIKLEHSHVNLFQSLDFFKNHREEK